MGMSWYFALSESSIERDEHDWRGLIRVAVTSAYRNTRLRPTLVYDGQPGEFTAELANAGVRIIYHRVSFFDDLARHADAIGQPWWLSIASGAFLRTEIPLLHSGTDAVLYTDCDVMFTKDPGNLDCGRAPFAVVPEQTQRGHGHEYRLAASQLCRIQGIYNGQSRDVCFVRSVGLSAVLCRSMAAAEAGVELAAVLGLQRESPDRALARAEAAVRPPGATGVGYSGI